GHGNIIDAHLAYQGRHQRNLGGLPLVTPVHHARHRPVGVGRRPAMPSREQLGKFAPLGRSVRATGAVPDAIDNLNGLADHGGEVVDARADGCRRNERYPGCGTILLPHRPSLSSASARRPEATCTGVSPAIEARKSMTSSLIALRRSEDIEAMARSHWAKFVGNIGAAGRAAIATPSMAFA